MICSRLICCRSAAANAYNYILRSFVRDIFSVYQTHHSTPWFGQTTGQHLSSRKRLCLKKTDATGLNSRLGPKNKNPQPPKGTDELECFIKDIQRELIGKILPHNDTQKQERKSIEPISASIQDVMKSLKDTNQVIIPTDKTNSFELLDIKTLDIFIQKHINKKAKQIDKERLSTTVDEALKLIEEWKNNGTLNEKEAKYAFESIQSRAVPVPKLLIKDHKDKDENGNYPTRLVVPATNFTAAIPNLGYRGIRQIFDQEKVNYTRKTIIEAAHLKTELETLNIKHWGSPPSGLVQAQELDISIMWKGNALSTMKTFGTRNCVLCAKERVAIVKHWWKDKKTLINSNTEIFGGCRNNEISQVQRQKPSQCTNLYSYQTPPGPRKLYCMVTESWRV